MGLKQARRSRNYCGSNFSKPDARINGRLTLRPGIYSTWSVKTAGYNYIRMRVDS